MARDSRVTVRLSPAEVERLDGFAAGRGLSRAGALRALLRDPGEPPAAVPAAADAVALLAESARDGSVTARVALARLLSRPDARSPVERRLDELAAKRKARAHG